MDVFSKNRLTVWAITVLVFLNLLLLGTLWWGHIHRPPAPQDGQGNGPERHYRAMIRFLERELDLNAGQVEKLNALFKQHVAQMSLVMQDMLTRLTKVNAGVGLDGGPGLRVGFAEGDRVCPDFHTVQRQARRQLRIEFNADRVDRMSHPGAVSRGCDPPQRLVAGRVSAYGL